MSQCSAERFVPPHSGYAEPSARCIVPPIFSSKRMLRVKTRTRVVQPERELAHPPRALVERDHLLQEVLAARGGRLDDLALLEAQAHVVHLPAAEDRGEREA